MPKGSPDSSTEMTLENVVAAAAVAIGAREYTSLDVAFLQELANQVGAEDLVELFKIYVAQQREFNAHGGSEEYYQLYDEGFRISKSLSNRINGLDVDVPETEQIGHWIFVESGLGALSYGLHALVGALPLEEPTPSADRKDS